MYFSGSVVSGTLSFSLEQAKSFKYVNVKLIGDAYVHWTETRTRTTGSGDNQRTETYEVSFTSSEIYVEQVAELWSNHQSPTGTIGPGYYEYQFQFTLPPTCPSSFQGSVGRIEYAIKGRIGTGLFRFDHRVSAPIQVNRIIDINHPSMLMPVRQTKNKKVGFWCCAAGDVNFTVELPRTGYCVNGDTVPLRVHVENGSSREISIKASIIQQICYYAEGHQQSSGSTVALAESQQIQPRTTTSINFPNFRVPNVQPTLLNTNIIKLDYKLKVWAVIPWSVNPSLVFPIVIGNVPFQGELSQSAAPLGRQPNPIPFESLRQSDCPIPSAPQLEPQNDSFDEPGDTARLLPKDDPPTYKAAVGDNYY